MTKDELLARLAELDTNDRDTEIVHIDADKALREYINDADVSEAYNKIHKWYA